MIGLERPLWLDITSRLTYVFYFVFSFVYFPIVVEHQFVTKKNRLAVYSYLFKGAYLTSFTDVFEAFI
jgi:hypothetical protein